MKNDKQPKLKLKTIERGIDPAAEAALEEFAAQVIEARRDSFKSSLESFEQYSDRLKVQIFDNLSEFYGRFVRGYGVLLEELEKADSKEHS